MNRFGTIMEQVRARLRGRRPWLLTAYIACTLIYALLECAPAPLAVSGGNPRS